MDNHASTLALAAGGGVLPHGTTTLRHLFSRTTPGFGAIQSFFSRWLNLDVTTLALALTVFGVLSRGANSLKYVGLKIYRWVIRFFTASVSVPGTDRLNGEILNWVADQVLERQETRILTACSEPTRDTQYRQSRKANYRHEKRLPIQYLPAFGLTWFFHDRSVILVRRVGRISSSSNPADLIGAQSPDQYTTAPTGNEPLVVMCLGRSVDPIKKFFETCRQFADKQNESFVAIRFPAGRYYKDQWSSPVLRPHRLLETLHMNKSTKDDLASDVDNYLKPATRRFYTARGIPYRRGYLLHGPPGTGKSSLSVALAGKYELELYILNIPSLKSESDMESLFTSLPPKCIVLLEDIDAVGMKRQHEPLDDDDEEAGMEYIRKKDLREKSSISLSGLLNVLDGVASQEGRIVVMTSNFAEDLDEALIRPGRIDKIVYMSRITSEAAEEMFLRMYTRDQEEEADQAEPRVKFSIQELKKLAADFRECVPDDLLTGAQLQGYLLNRRDDPERAAAEIQQWTGEQDARMQEARAREQAARKRRLKQWREERAEKLAVRAAKVARANRDRKPEKESAESSWVTTKASTTAPTPGAEQPLSDKANGVAPEDAVNGPPADQAQETQVKPKDAGDISKRQEQLVDAKETTGKPVQADTDKKTTESVNNVDPGLAADA